MNNSAVAQCEECGAVLPAADSVCLKCESMFREVGHTRASRFQCPRCTRSFGAPLLEWHPQNKGWYWPKSQLPRCPHCLVFLRDRRQPSIKSAWGGAYIIGLLGLVFAPSSNATRAIAAFLFIMVFAVIHHQVHARISDRDRFAVREV
jgi:hypothetical protein